MNLSKQKQCGRRFKGDLKKINRPESELQDFTNAHLKASGVDYWRVPDNTKIKALRGFPDNLCLVRVSGEFCLALSVELKTRSALHGAQVTKSHDLAYCVAQTEEAVERAVWSLRRQAQKCKDCLKKSVEKNDVLE